MMMLDALKFDYILIPCSATADSTAFNTGGKIKVGGLSITIPKNLQIQFPAAWVPFKDFASGGYTGDEISVGPVVHLLSLVQTLTRAIGLWQLC